MNRTDTQLDQNEVHELQERLLAARHALMRERSGAESELESIESERDIELEEVAQDEQTADVLRRLTEQQYARLRQIDGALERIDRGQYGRCIDCGQAISVERLRAEPWTARCAACAAAREDAPPRLGDSERDPGEERREEQEPAAAEAPAPEDHRRGAPLAPELDALDDAEVAESIQEAFRTEVGSALDTVRVLCRNRVVILAGEVANETLPEIAHRIVEDEIGYEVVDRMMITGFADGPRQPSADVVRPHQLPATGQLVDEDNESDLSEDVLEVEEEGLTFVPPTRPVPER